MFVTPPALLVTPPENHVTKHLSINNMYEREYVKKIKDVSVYQ